MLLDIKRVMLSFLSICFVALLIGLVAPNSAFAQAIHELKSSMNVAASGNVDVVEELKISFPSTKQRNQFYRVLPIWYQKQRNIHVVDINVKKVMMDDKSTVPFKSWVSGRDLYLKIGDQTTPLKGDHKFRIEYEVLNGVQFVNGTPELLLSVTGDSCPFVIQKALVTITLPKGTDMSRVKAATLTGATGQWKTTSAGNLAAGTVQLSAQNIQPAQGMNIVVGMPRGVVVPHSVLLDWVLYLQKFYQVFVLPVATMVALSAWWFFNGRDPAPEKGSEAGNWFPPDYITAAEAGTLVDESCDLKDIISTVIDLAARGFINIRVLPYNGFFYLDNRDYEFTLLKSPKDRELKDHEQLFIAALFGSLSTTTYASAVRGNFAEYLPAIRRKIYSTMVTEGLFARDPEVDRKNFVFVGAAVVTMGIGLMAASTYHIGGQATAAGTVISGIILLLAARAMPRRTAKGVTALKQLRRFERMLIFGSKKELQKVAKDNPEAFHKFFAYAHVLGLANVWTEIFAETVTDYPIWYRMDSSLLPDKFEARRFVPELNAGLSVINKALTDPPYTAKTVNSYSLMGSHHRHY